MGSDIFCNGSIPEPVSTVNVSVTNMNIQSVQSLWYQAELTPVGSVLTLASYPLSDQAVMLFKNGDALIQGAEEDYVMNGLTATLTEEPEGTDKFLVCVMTSANATFASLAVGASTLWYGSVAGIPAGWLEEDGSALSRTEYSALFAVIGTTYGAGDGITTFNLPNRSAATTDEYGNIIEVTQMMKVM